MTQEVLKLALDWAEAHGEIVFAGGGMSAVNKMNSWVAAIKEALAQPEQKPVAWRAPRWSNLHGEYGYRDFNDPVIDISTGKPSLHNEPLYLTPPQRTWVDLTRTQMQDVYFAVLEEHRGGHQIEGQLAFGEALQAKIKERNT